MRSGILKKLDEADELIRVQLHSAKNGMRTLEEDRYAKIRTLIQEAITLLHRINTY